jgi:hypothetical protein
MGGGLGVGAGPAGVGIQGITAGRASPPAGAGRGPQAAISTASARAAYRTVVPRTGDSTTKKNGLARRGLQVLQIRGLPSLCNVVAQINATV